MEEGFTRIWMFPVLLFFGSYCICNPCTRFVELEPGTYDSRSMQSKPAGARHYGSDDDSEPTEFDGYRDVSIQYEAPRTLVIEYEDREVESKLKELPRSDWESYPTAEGFRMVVQETFVVRRDPLPVGPYEIENPSIHANYLTSEVTNLNLEGIVEVDGERRDLHWHFEHRKAEEMGLQDH